MNIDEMSIYIDASALPLVALAQWAKERGYRIKQDGKGRVYFEAVPRG